MTEDDVRRIVREELDRAFPQRHAIAPLPAGPNYPTQPLYNYQRPYYPGGPWPVTCASVLASITVQGDGV